MRASQRRRVKYLLNFWRCSCCNRMGQCHRTAEKDVVACSQCGHLDTVTLDQLEVRRTKYV